MVIAWLVWTPPVDQSDNSLDPQQHRRWNDDGTMSYIAGPALFQRFFVSRTVSSYFLAYVVLMLVHFLRRSPNVYPNVGYMYIEIILFAVLYYVICCIHALIVLMINFLY